MARANNMMCPASTGKRSMAMLAPLRRGRVVWVVPGRQRRSRSPRWSHRRDAWTEQPAAMHRRVVERAVRHETAGMTATEATDATDVPTASDAEARRVEAAIDALLATCDPRTTDRVTFRAARYDHGLAWVHFDPGFGGLGVRPDLNRHVERRRCGGPPPPPG